MRYLMLDISTITGYAVVDTSGDKPKLITHGEINTSKMRSELTIINPKRQGKMYSDITLELLVNDINTINL